MASVGSVELTLSLSRTQFDKELRSLSSIEIPPLNLDLKLDAKSLNKQLKDLKNGDYGCLELEICPDIKGLSRKLKELPKSLVDCIPVEICPELDTESLKRQFDAIKDSFKVQVQASVTSALKVSASAENTRSDRAKEKLEAGFDEVADTLATKINTAIEKSLANLTSAVTAPFRSTFTGFFEGIGQNLSRELSNGAIRTFQKTLDISFKSVGGKAGGFAAKEVGKALGLKPIPKPRVKRDDDESGGASTRKTSPKPQTPPDSGLSKELKAIASELDTFADIMRRAGLGGDKFGASTLKAAKEALELAATFEGLRSAIVAKKSAATTTPSATTAPSATASATSSRALEVQADTLAQTAKRGFLKGDVTKVTKEQAKAQVEKVRSRLEKDLAELQALPESEQTAKKIEGLLKKISQLQARIALDIANPEIPKAVRQSLGQLKSTQSKLAETQRNIEATAAKSTANRKLPGIAKAAAGGLGASVLGAGGAFAAPTGGAGLGALGALPFDPTLGLAAGGLAAAFAAAKFTPRLLRKVGAQKAADVLEIDVGKIAIDAVTGVFTNVRTSLKNSFTGFGRRFEKFVGLNDPIKDREALSLITKESGVKQAFTNLDINLQKNRGFLPAPSKELLPPPKVDLSPLPKPSKEQLQLRTEIAALNKVLAQIGRTQVNPNTSKFLGAGFEGKAYADRGLVYKLSTLRPVSDEARKERVLAQNTAASFGLAPRLLRSQVVGGKEIQIMEQVVGTSLDKFVKTMSKSVDGLSLEFANDVAKFVAKLHSSGVAHRDLGLQNLFRETKTGAIKGIDFNSSINLDTLSEKDQVTARNRDKNRLIRQLKSSYKGQLSGDQLADLFDGAYATEFERATKNVSTRNVNKKKLKEVGVLSTYFFNNLFDKVEDAFFDSKIFGKLSKKEARSLTSEATGFLASGALLGAPGATGVALAAPLITALTPLITTLGLVASAVGPLVGTIANTLKRIEPLQKRLEFTSGGKAGAKSDTQFIQGLAGNFGIAEISSLEQFTKFQAAARGTRLEGEALKELFEGIVLGTKALGLSTEDLNLVFYGFQNIIGKSKLSSEEIRLQIAERFAPAVGVFSRALGVTTQEFNRLLESGSLLAENVLPKVAKQLKLEFGGAAKEGAKTFDSALTRVSNAIDRVKVGLATTLAPVLTSITNSIGGVLEFFAQNAQKIVGIAGVVLTGISAQFFVGLTQILENTGVISKATSFLAPLFGRILSTLAPFAVGILADFLDDIFGAQTSVMENLMRGSYNAVLSVILVFNDLKNAVSSTLANLPKNDSLSGLGGVISGIGNALKPIGGLLRGTVVEFTSLSLILAQTFVLAKQGLTLVLARLGTTIAELSTSFVASVRSGKVFQSTLSTLTAGLNLTQLAVVGLTSALVLFFAKADFSDDLGKKFDELGDRVTSNLDRISEKLKKTGKDLDKLPGQLPEFKSKGFDLTVGLGDIFGKGAFRSDDLIKQIRNLKRESSAFKEIGIGSILGSINPALQIGFNTVGSKTKTFAESSFDRSLDKLASSAKEIKQAIDVTSLLSSDFESSAPGKALDQIKRFDEQIEKLQGRRGELLSGPKANTDEVKKQIGDIDNLIAAFLKKRSEVVKPIEAVKDTVLQASKDVQGFLEVINDSDAPEAAKEKARKALQPTIDLVETAKKRLGELGAIDLSPLGNQFTQVTAEIEKSDRALERTLGKIGLNTTKRLTKTANDLASGTITPDVAARENTDTELADLKARGRSLDSFVKARRESIKQLQAVPKPTTEQVEAIDKYQKEVEAKELELAQNRLQIANKITEGKKQSEGRILKDFQTANAQAAAVVQKAEAARIERTKRRQLSGSITDEEAQLEISSAGVTAAKADLTIAQDALVEFQKIRKTGKISAEEIATRELELNKQVSDAIVRSLDAEIAKRDSLKQKRIADIEELRAKEQAGIDATRTNAANRIKEQQLTGTLSPDEAASNSTEAEIVAAVGTLVLARKRLDDIKKLRQEGTLNAKEAAQREREAIASVATAEGQILDLRLQKQQQFREQNLRRIEEANNRAIALIESSQAQADIAVLNRQIDSPRNEESDRASERALAFNAAEATRKKIVQAQKEISQLSRANFETEADYIAKRTELNNNLTTLVKEGLEQQLQKQRQVQEDAVRAIDRRVQAQKNQSDLAVQGLEDQKAALDLLNSSIDRSKQLIESRSSVAKATADLAITMAEIALESAPDSSKQQLSVNLANLKLSALKQEQITSTELLALDLKRQRLSAEMAVSEAEIAQSRALIAQLEIAGELAIAQGREDSRAIASAQAKLDLQEKIVSATQAQLENSRATLNVQDELSANAQKALTINQQAAIAQGQAAVAAAAKLNNLDSAPASSGISRGDALSSTVSDKKPKKLSLFEQSRLNMLAPLPTNKNVGLAPEYFNLKAVTQKAATNSTGSGSPSMSAEAELNALAGLKPNESVEDLLKRQLGIDPAESVENYLKKPMSLFYGQDRNNSFQNLNEKYPPKADSLRQLEQMYAPKVRSFDELNRQYKTDAGTFDELNERYAPSQTKANQSTDLKMANKGIEERLDRLNATLATAINSPRNLYVSSPEPISDAVSILADINRMNIQSSGLG